jgi:flagellin FlaB
VTTPTVAVVFFAAFTIAGFSVAVGVLDAGTYGAEEASETIMVSLDSVLATLQTRGSVAVIDANDDGAIDESDHILFNLGSVAGGIPVLVDPAADGGSVIINYADDQDRVPGIAYAVAEISGDGDNLLETGELFEVTVNPPTGSRLDVNEAFGLEIMLPQGAVLTIDRTMPAAIDRVMNLH